MCGCNLLVQTMEVKCAHVRLKPCSNNGSQVSACAAETFLLSDSQTLLNIFIVALLYVTLFLDSSLLPFNLVNNVLDKNGLVLLQLPRHGIRITDCYYITDIHVYC